MLSLLFCCANEGIQHIYRHSISLEIVVIGFVRSVRIGNHQKLFVLKKVAYGQRLYLINHISTKVCVVRSCTDSNGSRLSLMTRKEIYTIDFLEYNLQM